MPLDASELALIRKYAVKNAVDYGKASVASVLGKAMSQIRDSRARFAEIKAAVEGAVGTVNGLAKDELADEYGGHETEFEQERRRKVEDTAKPKIHIDGAVDGEVVTRFSPEPGGYIHIGSLKHCILNEEVARVYSGKIYLYFDDTNPEISKQEYVDAIRRDTAWAGVRFAKEYFASDHIEDIYESGRTLLRQGNAYACSCSDEEIEKGRTNMSECAHRSRPAEDSLSAFEGMLAKKYDEGGMIIRLKGDMKSENGSLRDPTLFRIKNAEHYRQGTRYVVWPTYHMNTPVMDSAYGITDVIRGKEYETWEVVNRMMLKALGLRAPRMHYEARLRIIGAVTGKRDVRKLIKEGYIKSWDDPRLLTVAALRRRGIQPDAIREFVLRFGLSKTDSLMSIDMLLAENKRYIDPIAKHLYFVDEPVKLSVKGAEGLRASMRLHPQKDMGTRDYTLGGEVYISGGDAAGINAGDAIRLKDFADVVVESKGGDGLAASISGVAEGSKIVQWVPGNDHVKCTVMVPKSLIGDGGRIDVEHSQETVAGYAEGFANALDERDIVQFERFGYCVLDDKKAMSFIYLSK